MPDLTQMNTEQLTALYEANRTKRTWAVHILAELERREAKRKANGQQLIVGATRLKETIRTELQLITVPTPPVCVVAAEPAPKPWYRRGGVVVSFLSLAVAAVAQGIFHAAGYHMWEPIVHAIRNAWQVVGALTG
jgi:hypothetical protein